MNRIYGVLVIIIILGLFLWKFLPMLGNQNKGPVTITYTDFWDENLIKPVISEFERTHPKIKVKYVSESQLNFRTRVQTQIREGFGPDVFPIHNSWLPMFKDDLAPAPTNILTVSDFVKTFYPVAGQSFIKDSQIYAAPLGVDGLALYINEDILTGAGVEVPKTWTDFVTAASKLTVKDTDGTIKTAGAALGTTTNVDYWSNILGLMLLQQPGIDLKNPSGEAVAQVLKFYTGFITDPTKKVWDTNLLSSTQMFKDGHLAFYFAPYSKTAEIKAANPTLKFKIVPVPQLPGSQVAWASFWGEAVSGKSMHSSESWQLVKFLTSKEVSRFFGIPNARLDLAATQTDDSFLGAYVNQGPYYRFWYLESGVENSGINEDMIKVWETGINSVLSGTSADSALSAIQNGVKQTLVKYKIN